MKILLLIIILLCLISCDVTETSITEPETIYWDTFYVYYDTLEYTDSSVIAAQYFVYIDSTFIDDSIRIETRNDTLGRYPTNVTELF